MREPVSATSAAAALDVAIRDHADLTPAAPLLPPADVAQMLKVSRRTIRRLVAAGDLEEILVAPKSPRITPKSLAAHLARQRGRSSQCVVSAA